ncbi:tetratricopeptide repeat protein [Neobacillus niacini]|uniref:tetratricopeptide repeat protein n=1 Tax=Neobacillus niacini TaxID=86668 RepID=UPI0021CB666E|nr:tetratricopeptide repeat protein [Neobacillus niacini]MCM3765485.1 sel1 repeat family protein [Neobacillus niacini]
MQEHEFSNINSWDVIGENNNEEEDAFSSLYKKAENQMYKGNYREAIDLYEMAANLGVIEAQSYLANLYLCGLNGTDIEPNHPKALKWFQKLAEHGDEIAQFQCDYLHYFGVGTTKEDRETLETVLQGSEVDERNALKLVGQMYYFGEGVMQDVWKGIEFFKKVADLGDVEGQIAVCACYLEIGKIDETISCLNMIENANYDLVEAQKNWLAQIKSNIY